MNHTHARGFTLVELLVVLAIAAILFGIAIPAFSNFVRSNQLVSHKNAFLSAMSFARSEAITRNRRIYICAKSNHACSEQNIWENGWLVYLDDNGNRLADADEILREFDPLPQNYSVRSNTHTHTLMFLPNGFARRASGALPLMTFEICAPGANQGAIENLSFEVVVNASGRMRSQRGQQDTHCPSA